LAAICLYWLVLRRIGRWIDGRRRMSDKGILMDNWLLFTGFVFGFFLLSVQRLQHGSPTYIHHFHRVLRCSLDDGDVEEEVMDGYEK
jgi:hypothetical protein